MQSNISIGGRRRQPSGPPSLRPWLYSKA